MSVVFKKKEEANITNQVSVLMPVEIPKRGIKDSKVAVCVQATFNNIDRRRLVEWFEMQRLLGVSHIGVYITPRTLPDTRQTLAHYDATPLVERRTIDYLDGGRGSGHGLMVNLAAINDCIYRHLYTHRFVAIIDFDEVRLSLYIFPVRQTDIFFAS